MRAGMFHQHVIVHVLPAIGHKQAVDQAFASLACQHRMHIVTHKRAAQQKRMRAYIGIPALLYPQRRKVICLAALAHDHVMKKREHCQRPLAQ